MTGLSARRLITLLWTLLCLVMASHPPVFAEAHSAGTPAMQQQDGSGHLVILPLHPVAQAMRAGDDHAPPPSDPPSTILARDTFVSDGNCRLLVRAAIELAPLYPHTTSCKARAPPLD